MSLLSCTCLLKQYMYGNEKSMFVVLTILILGTHCACLFLIRCFLINNFVFLIIKLPEHFWNTITFQLSHFWFPDMQERVDRDSMSSETEEDVRRFCPNIRELTNVRCDLGVVNSMLPKNWKDNIDHECMDITGSVSWKYLTTC